MKQELCINCKLNDDCEMKKSFEGLSVDIAICHKREGDWVQGEPSPITGMAITVGGGDKDEIQTT